MIKKGKRIPKSICLGFSLEYYLKEDTDINYIVVLNDLIELLKKRRLECGSGGEDGFSTIIVAERRRCCATTEEDRKIVEAWGKNHPLIADIRVGSLVNINEEIE